MMLLAVFAICAVIFSANGGPIGNVGFSASLSASGIYQAGEIVKYGNVLVNYGNGYNKDTGVFTAPKTGLYVFHVNGLAPKTFGFWFSLYRNDELVASFMGRDPQFRAPGGNSIAMRVKSGERVFVKGRYAPSNVFEDGLSRYNTFTGYLVAVGTDK